jgi:hypothetical protein
VTGGSVTDTQDRDPVLAFVAERIREDGWTPIDAINWAHDRDVVERYRLCLMFVRLCADPESRADPLHAYLHLGYGVRDCPAGQALLTATQHSLGLSDTRATFLIDQLDREMRALAGMVGSE